MRLVNEAYEAAVTTSELMIASYSLALCARQFLRCWSDDVLPPVQTEDEAMTEQTERREARQPMPMSPSAEGVNDGRP